MGILHVAEELRLTPRAAPKSAVFTIEHWRIGETGQGDLPFDSADSAERGKG